MLGHKILWDSVMRSPIRQGRGSGQHSGGPTVRFEPFIGIEPNSLCGPWRPTERNNDQTFAKEI